MQPVAGFHFRDKSPVVEELPIAILGQNITKLARPVATFCRVLRFASAQSACWEG